ncbi:MAG TPA: peptidylprolyl isomerase [Polyangiaceae bacterium]
MSRGYQLGPGIWTLLSYRVFDAEGEALDTEPVVMGCVFGFGALLPGVEAALEGKRVGARCSVELAPDEAFGERDATQCLEVERGEFPPDVAPGDRFDAEREDGTPQVLSVLEVTEESVILDLNHPLAGQRVRFEVEVLEARPATAEELALAEAVLADEPAEGGLGLGSDPQGGPPALIDPTRLLRRGTQR